MLKLHYLRKLLVNNCQRFFSTSLAVNERHCCKLLVVGGGCAGCNIAAKFTKILKKDEIIILEPEDVHFYQPYFTLVGTGVKQLKDCVRATALVLPRETTWIKDSVATFCPNTNCVITENNEIIEYEFMIIAIGVKPTLDKIPGLVDGLDNYRNVSTIFMKEYVQKTAKCLREYVEGPAIFTAPNSPVKCFAAAFKICFLAESYLKKQEKLADAEIIYTTPTPFMFPCQKYDKIIWDIVKRKRINVCTKTNLVEVVPDRNKAIFECVDNPRERFSFEYSMLHVTPPMRPPDALAECEELVTKNRHVNANKDTLQHVKYSNIYSVGDCNKCPFNKTVGAAAEQVQVVFKNLSDVMRGKSPTASYNGYTSCPVLTEFGKCLLAEFDYDLEPCETVPFFINTENTMMYYCKKEVMPRLYWEFMMTGKWSGVSRIRYLLNLNFLRDEKSKSSKTSKECKG